MTTPIASSFPSAERMREALQIIKDVHERTKWGYSCVRDEPDEIRIIMSRKDILFLHNNLDYLRMEIASIFRAALAYRQEGAARHHCRTCPPCRNDPSTIDLDFIKFEED
jgi:hypothetical protein